MAESHGNQSSRQQRAERDDQVWRLRLTGWSEAKIAEHVGVHTSTVSRILRRREQELLAKLEEEIKYHKVTMNYMLEHIIDEAMCGWERSKQPRRKTCKGRRGSVVSVEERVGDPGFLDVAMTALSNSAKLWGLEAWRASPQSFDLASLTAQLEERQRAIDSNGDTHHD